MNTKKFLTFALIITFLIILKFNTLTTPFHWDAMGYVIPSTESFYNKGVIINKPWSTGHPPLFFIGLSLVWKIFGKSLLVSHLFNIFIGALGLSFLFFMTKNLYGEKVACVALIFLSFNQIFFAQLGLLHLAISLTSMAILSVKSYIENKRLLYIVSTTLMLLIKETTVIVLISILLFDFILELSNKENLRIIFKRIAFLSMPFISLIIWFFSHWLVNGWFLNTNLLINKGKNFIFSFAELFARYLIYDPTIENVNKVNWVIIIIMTISFFVCAKKRSFKYEILFLLLIVLNIGFFSYTDDMPRYFIIIFPFLGIMGARASVMLTNNIKFKNLGLMAIVLSITVLSVMNYTGNRSTDGWRLESNMEYLDMLRLHQKVCVFVENNYTNNKILTNFPLNTAFKKPWYGYVEKPMDLIQFSHFEGHKNVLIVWSSQSNFLNMQRFIETYQSQLEIMKYFSNKGKTVKLLKRKLKGVY